MRAKKGKVCIGEDFSAEKKHLKYIEKVYFLLSNPNAKHSDASRIFETFAVDQSILKILANLNEYNSVEMKLLYKIFKLFLKYNGTHDKLRKSSANSQKSSYEIVSFTKNTNFDESTVKRYLIENIQNIVEALLENINPSNKIKSDAVVSYVGKLFRTIFKQEFLFEKILNFEFFSEIYFYMKSEKFIINNEAFKIIQSLVQNSKVSTRVFEKFLTESKEEICALINSTIVLDKNKNECNFYFVKRESLKVC